MPVRLKLGISPASPTCSNAHAVECESKGTGCSHTHSPSVLALKIRKRKADRTRVRAGSGRAIRIFCFQDTYALPQPLTLRSQSDTHDRYLQHVLGSVAVLGAAAQSTPVAICVRFAESNCISLTPDAEAQVSVTGAPGKPSPMVFQFSTATQCARARGTLASHSANPTLVKRRGFSLRHAVLFAPTP